MCSGPAPSRRHAILPYIQRNVVIVLGDRPRVSHLRLPRAMIWLRVLEIFWWFAKRRHTTGTHSPQTAHQDFRIEGKTTQLLPTSGIANHKRTVDTIPKNQRNCRIAPR